MVPVFSSESGEGRIWRVTLTVALLIGSLGVGCSAPVVSDSGVDVGSVPQVGNEQVTYEDNAPEFTGEVPEFTGPYAAVLTKEYRETTSDFARRVLADGVISDQELAEMRTNFEDCLKSHGFTDITFEPDGAFSFQNPAGGDSSNKFDDKVKECSVKTGEDAISYMHSTMRRNPENLDEYTIMAACLVRKGVVDKDYDAKAYRSDFENSTGPLEVGLGINTPVEECNADPLGLFE